ncbi:TIGR03885 family FMN-dependent LLM class oxidoreductase [Ornithinimicrobium pratense]|uniref:TIGR03885 family FMN-dependent LLM class oxidoreductase n=1 Tax=Ornithinimicrobium pratense TaxID=2593973 RepID=A0A5J6V937_9MICO|nr:TIGR03885 family FMN-dependent LLM class oxidoreductase [Ornithinimicrobium pratense]QFG69623.1 TIGR03885 family FMN-dependent LLM class oxidoreductase [Ornithinimicrobium pratense]
MTRIGFHASHEQISPRQLLADVQHAERAGFQMAMCSDHLAPWSTRQGHSGYTWSWLGAALATTELELGCVSAPGQRYHPVVHAQRIATLGQMFPGRFWAALGSGQNMNEHVTGDPWPRKEIRTQRLEECVDVIRRLLAGETVSHDGLIRVHEAQIWERADPVPPLLAPAITVESAGRVAAWGEGLVTLNQPIEVLRDLLAAYREAGGAGPAALQVHLSWAPRQEEAERIAHDQWRSNVFDEPVDSDTAQPVAFDIMSEHVSMDAVHEAVKVSADLEQHVEWLQEYAELGFDDLYLHFVGQQQDEFIDVFAEQVLPKVVPRAGAAAR